MNDSTEEKPENFSTMLVSITTANPPETLAELSTKSMDHAEREFQNMGHIMPRLLMFKEGRIYEVILPNMENDLLNMLVGNLLTNLDPDFAVRSAEAWMVGRSNLQELREACTSGDNLGDAEGAMDVLLVICSDSQSVQVTSRQINPKTATFLSERQTLEKLGGHETLPTWRAKVGSKMH